MSAAFASLAVVLLLTAAAFVAWPLWRVAPSVAGAAPTPPRRGAAIGLGAGVVLAAIGVYAGIGDPRAWLQPELLQPVARAEPAMQGPADGADTPDQAPGQSPAMAAGASPEGIGPAQIEAMVQRLAARLQTQPDDAAGWRMLAKSYETLRRFDEAAHAYRRLIALEKPDADLLVDYAVALGMSQGQTLAGEPEALLGQALKLQPGHPQALALSGSAAFERRDHARAIAQWQKLLEELPPGSEMRASVQANIDQARALAKAGR